MSSSTEILQKMQRRKAIVDATCDELSTKLEEARAEQRELESALCTLARFQELSASDIEVAPAGQASASPQSNDLNGLHTADACAAVLAACDGKRAHFAPVAHLAQARGFRSDDNPVKVADAVRTKMTHNKDRFVTEGNGFFCLYESFDSDLSKPSGDLVGATIRESARAVLETAGHPMHYQKIVDEALKRGYRPQDAEHATREKATQSFYAKLRQIREFAKTSKATFGLPEWNDKKENSGPSELADI